LILRPAEGERKVEGERVGLPRFHNTSVSFIAIDWGEFCFVLVAHQIG